MSNTAMHALQGVIIDALRAAPALAGISIYDNEPRPLPADTSSAIFVNRLSSRGDPVVLGCVDWKTAFEIICVSTSDAPSVDALVFDAWAILAALQPEGFGLLVFDLDPEIDFQTQKAATFFAASKISLTAIHRTASANLSPLN